MPGGVAGAQSSMIAPYADCLTDLADVFSKHFDSALACELG